MEGICSHCYQLRPVEEIGKYTLCKEHKNLKQYQPKKQPKKYINRISSKQKESIEKKKNTYKLMAQIKDKKCTGCGTTDNLTHSHLISVAQRKDLEANIVNITYHCSTCHNVWEHDILGRTKLKDYCLNMLKIMHLDSKYYNKLKIKENELRLRENKKGATTKDNAIKS